MTKERMDNEKVTFYIVLTVCWISVALLVYFAKPIVNFLVKL